ncbi:hypothetical protein C8R46DRAFT_425312 [Mycena filopes]|nr:hypothetical protein C8R46DRAFT_425312 [Mycena filopes]
MVLDEIRRAGYRTLLLRFGHPLPPTIPSRVLSFAAARHLLRRDIPLHSGARHQGLYPPPPQPKTPSALAALSLRGPSAPSIISSCSAIDIYDAQPHPAIVVLPFTAVFTLLAKQPPRNPQQPPLLAKPRTSTASNVKSDVSLPLAFLAFSLCIFFKSLLPMSFFRSRSTASCYSDHDYLELTLADVPDQATASLLPRVPPSTPTSASPAHRPSPSSPSAVWARQRNICSFSSTHRDLPESMIYIFISM